MGREKGKGEEKIERERGGGKKGDGAGEREGGEEEKGESRRGTRRWGGKKEDETENGQVEYLTRRHFDDLHSRIRRLRYILLRVVCVCVGVGGCMCVCVHMFMCVRLGSVYFGGVSSPW
jgi:hypothetical protein